MSALLWLKILGSVRGNGPAQRTHLTSRRCQGAYRHGKDTLQEREQGLVAGCGVRGRGEWREESWVVALERASSVRETEQIPESRGAEARLGKAFRWAPGWRRPGAPWFGAGVGRQGLNEGVGLGDTEFCLCCGPGSWAVTEGSGPPAALDNSAAMYPSKIGSE